MTKILFVMTGGTIGSYSHNGIISVKQNNCRALELFRENYPSDTEFEITQPLNILSENLEKYHWESLVNFLYRINTSKYNGIIITHGSDTLSYTSAMLAICLNHFDIPVVITASNYIPDDKRSNAVENIRSAVTVINNFQNGVFTVYKNDGDEFCSVFRSDDICEADRLHGRFTSFKNSIFGKVIEGKFKKTSDHEIIKHRFFDDEALSLQNDVMMIKPYPSMLYSAINIPESVKAVLHVTYHSCTAKTDGSQNALDFLELCKAKNTDFYITSVRNSSVYETSNILIKNGAVPIYDTSDETALAKLLLYYNCNITDRKNFL